MIGLDSDYNELTETISLSGTNPVVTTNTFWRLSRSTVLTAGANETNIGEITARHTTTTNNVFMVMPSGFGQTEIAAYTIPANYSGYLRDYDASILDNTSNNALIGLWIRPYSGAAKTIRPFGVSTNYINQKKLYGGEPLPPKSDIKMKVLRVQNTNADITAHFQILLVKN